MELKINRKKLRSRSGGFTSAAMWCAVLILFVIGVSVLSIGLHSRGLAVRTSSDISAADADITKAFFEMTENLKVVPWDDNSLPEVKEEILPNTSATYTYAVSGDLNNGYVVKSSGKSGLRERTVRCSLPLKGLFEYVIFGDEYIHLKNGGTIDWYNNDPNDNNLQIGTN